MTWKFISKYIDIETGEIITKHIAKKEYITIKTRKNARKTTQNEGIIEYTNECRRKWKQLQLQFNNT